MNVGTLWFDNDLHTPLIAKLDRAANYYRVKYGLVHPSMQNGRSNLVDSHVGKVAVCSNRVILSGHFWIGSEDKS